MASNEERTPPEPNSGQQKILPRRRNGKQQSCEPCRLAKAACDHRLPRCGRCARRGIEERCIYHPAPMTKAAGSPRVQKRTNEPNTKSPASDEPHLLQLLSHQCSTPNEFGEASHLGLNSPTSTEPQYLGSTSYSAVFEENKESIGEDWEDHIHALVAPEVTDAHLNTTISVLKALPDRETGEMLITSRFEIHDGPMHEPSTRYCFTSLWDTFGDALRDGANHEALRRMAHQILENTYSPVSSCRTAADWLQSHTGERIRCEVLGTLLSLFGLAVPALPETHSIFQGTSPKQLLYRFGRAAELCQELCGRISVVNEFTLYMHYQLSLVQSLYSGDDSGFFWRKSGHVATAITALGLHRESTVVNQTPFMVAEIRKRTFAAAFIVDKQLATLIGRPPRLSKRYSNCRLPLDLSDKEIMLQDSDLSRKKASLDANGWNTEGKVTRTGCLRARVIATQIRDEILELGLGPESKCTATKRDEVRAKSLQAFDTLPEQLKYPRDLSTLIPVQRSSIFTIRLEFLLNQYLLDRLPTEDAQQNKQALVDTAGEMLETLLVFLGQNHAPAGPWGRSSSRMIYYGIPSASVLAIELLRQRQHPTRFLVLLPRAKIVQNLSVFNHFLSTVNPINGNHVACARIHRVIQRILDQILEAVPGQIPIEPTMQLTPTELPSVNEEVAVPVDDADVDLPAILGPFDDMEFTEWFSAVDWTRGPWSNGV